MHGESKAENEISRQHARRLFAIGLVAVVCSVFLVEQCLQPPQVIPKNAPPEVFSAERAQTRLERILGDEQPHPIGVTANAQVRDRIALELEDLGLEPIKSDRWVPGGDEGSKSPSSLFYNRNLMAVLPSSHPDRKAVMLACHHDSVPAGPGASDDGVAVAAFLEVARALMSAGPLPRPVILFFADGEELGHAGARTFCEQNPLANQVGFVLNFEARGTAGGSIMFETSRSNQRIIREARALKRPITNSACVEIYRIMPNGSDLTTFMEHGMPGMNFGFTDNPKQYHSPLDNLSNLDPRSLQHHGEHALAMTRRLVQADLESLANAKHDAVYTDLFGHYILAWPAPWTPWMSGGVLVALLLLWRKSGRLSGGNIMKSIACVLSAILFAALFGMAAGIVLNRLDGGPIRFPADLRFFALSAGLASALGTLVAAYMFRPKAICLALVTSTLLATLALVFSLLLTGISYLFLLPAATYCGIHWLAVRQNDSPGPLALTCCLAAIVTGAVWSPLVLNVVNGLGTSIAPIQGIGVAILMLPIVPLFVYLQRREMAIWVGLPWLILTIAVLVISAQLPPFTKQSPQHVNLMYIERENEGGASLNIRTVDGSFPHSIVKDLESQEAPQDVPLDLPGRVVNVPSAGVSAPDCFILKKEQTAGIWLTTVHVQPSATDQSLLIGIPDKLEIRSIRVEQHELPISESNRGFHWCLVRGASSDGVTMEITSKKSDDSLLFVAGFASGLPESLAKITETRNALPATPRHMGDRTMAFNYFPLFLP